MRSSSFAFSTISLLALSVLARAQAPSVKPTPVPPSGEDIKLPAPPMPPREAVVKEEPIALRPRVARAPRNHSDARGFLAGLDHNQVMFDEPGDGLLWVAADGYKASFGPDGATYIPFLGARAARNFPMRFELRSIRAGADEIAFERDVAPVRQGNRIVFDRGIVDEVYDLSPDSIEQSFVLESPLDGEIVIDVVLETELARSSDENGLVLASATGSVRYGRAFAVDASVGRTALESGWHDDAIRIAVPAVRVAETAWPLVVDPVITTFQVDDDPTLADSAPDVAFDASTGYWMAVHERVFSATDHDVFFRVFRTDASVIATGSIDVTSANWVGPKVANNGLANQFLTVAAVGAPGSRIIRGRARDAGGPLDLPFTISGSEPGDKSSPDVGGDPELTAPTYYCVVWQRDVSPTDSDIHARMVRIDSTLFGGTIFLANENSTLDNTPSISKSNGPAPFLLQNWNIVWTRSFDLFDSDVMAVQVHWDGSIVYGTFLLETGVPTGLQASVSTSMSDDDRAYMVVFRRSPTGLADPDTWGFVYRGVWRIDKVNLTTLAGAPNAERQLHPTVDCDGRLFVVADQETNAGNTSNYDVYVSTFALIGGEITLGEGHQLLATSPTSEQMPELACAASAGGSARSTMIVWSDSEGLGNVEAAHYGATPFAQFCDPGVDDVANCPCGNAPSGANRGCNNSANTGGAYIWGTGDVSPDSVVLYVNRTLPNSLCLFVQGNGLLPSGVTFGDGVRCVSGTQLRLGQKVAVLGGSSFPQSGDPSITARATALGAPISAGQTRYYYAYYRDPALYACGGATFNATNALQVQW